MTFLRMQKPIVAKCVAFEVELHVAHLCDYFKKINYYYYLSTFQLTFSPSFNSKTKVLLLWSSAYPSYLTIGNVHLSFQNSTISLGGMPRLANSSLILLSFNVHFPKSMAWALGIANPIHTCPIMSMLNVAPPHPYNSLPPFGARALQEVFDVWVPVLESFSFGGGGKWGGGQVAQPSAWK